MLQILLGLLNPVGAIADKIADYRLKALEAKNDAERLRHEERIKTLEMQRDVLLQDTKYRLTRWIRPAFAYPPAFYYAKIWIWDKALGLGASDPVSDQLWWIAVAVIVFYFPSRAFEKWKTRAA